jgi:uncharacterized membrane protein YdjX (TVP38/TMEM64 family)
MHRTRRPTRLFAVAGLAVVLFATWMTFMPHSPGGLRELAEQAGPLGVVAFVALWGVATPALVSGTLLAGAGGMLFGPLTGSVVTLIGAAVGGAAAFGLSRRVGGDGLRGLGARAERMAAAGERRGFRSVLCLRAAPGAPATLVNYAAGISRISFRDFVLASAIGGAPRAVTYTVLGSTAAHPSPLAVAAPVAVLVAMAILGTVLAGATLRRDRRTATDAASA